MTVGPQTADGDTVCRRRDRQKALGPDHEGSGQLAIGLQPADAGADPVDPPGARYHVESQGYRYGDLTWTCNGTPRPGIDRLYPGWFDFAGSLYTNGSEFGPGIHTEAVRDDGTVAGLHSLEGIEGGGDNGSSARVEWSLHPAQ